MTPAQVLSNCRAQLYETTAAYWTDTELYGYMWYGEQEIAQLVPCTETKFITATVTDTSVYTSPSDILYYDRVTYDGVKLKRIDRTDLDAIDRPGYGSSLSTGQPTSYYEYAGLVYLWPIPQAIEPLVFNYYALPAQVTATAAGFTIPTYMQPFIQDYVLYRSYAKDQNEGLANFHKNLWDQDLSKASMIWAQRDQRDGHRTVRDSDNYPETELGII